MNDRHRLEAVRKANKNIHPDLLKKEKESIPKEKAESTEEAPEPTSVKVNKGKK